MAKAKRKPAPKRGAQGIRAGREIIETELLTATDAAPLWFDSEPIAIDATGMVADIEAAADAAESDGEGSDQPAKLPKVKTRAYNGGVMRPRVRSQSSLAPIPTLIDLATLKVDRNGSKLPCLYCHDREDPIGHFETVNVATSTIDAEGVLSVPGESRDKVAGGAKNGYRWAVSVGVETPELEYISSSDNATVNGRTVRGPLYVARRGVLKEISLLPIGADTSASATVTATLATETSMDQETTRIHRSCWIQR